MPGDQGIEVDPSRCRQGDGVGPGVGVPERAGHLELTGLDVGQRERDLVAAHADQDHPPGPAHRPDRRAGGGRVSGALQQHVRLDRGIGQRRFTCVDGLARAEFPGEFQPARVDIADRDVGGAERLRRLQAQQADRAGAGHEHPRARSDAGLAARPDADRQRLDQRGRVVGQAVRHGVGEPLVHRDVLAERAVDRRGTEEPHAGAEVVAPGPAVPAGEVRDAGLDRHPLAGLVAVGAGAGGNHDTGRFVPEDQRRLDHEVADPAVLVVVHVGPAGADRRDLHQHLARARPGNRPFLQRHPADAFQHRRPHRSPGHLPSLAAP